MLEYGINFSMDVRQIDLDVNRTYRNHIMFRERYNNKQQMLFRVLVAYSVYNSVRLQGMGICFCLPITFFQEIGYCQGMSQIAALLLMYQDEEVILSSIENILKAAGFIYIFALLLQDAFWSMSSLMSNDRHAMHGESDLYYSLEFSLMCFEL